MLLGYLRSSSAGLVTFDVRADYLHWVSTVAVVAVLLTFFLSHRIGKSSYSPLLNRTQVQLFVAVGYLLLGIGATAVTFVVHSIIIGQTPIPSGEELKFGIGVGAIFGFLVLMYIDRYEVETPGNTGEFEHTISKIDRTLEELNESDKAPIRLTDFYEALGRSMEEAVNCLRESSTEGGRKLAQDIEAWVEVFRGKPEVSQAMIVQGSRSPDEQELTELREEFESIIERLGRISNNE